MRANRKVDVLKHIIYRWQICGIKVAGLIALSFVNMEDIFISNKKITI